MGIELIRKARRQEVYGLTTPLVLKADGTKFGKTETETVWLDAARTSPYQLYQFFYRTEDSVVGAVPALLHLPRPRHHPGPRRRDRRSTPSAARRSGPWPARCARSCTGRRGGARRGRRPGAVLRESWPPWTSSRCSRCAPRHRPRPGRAPRSTETGSHSSTPLVDAGLAKSKSQARTLVTQGGVYVNDRRVKDTDARLGAQRTCSSTATSSCARGGTTISCASSDPPGDGRLMFYALLGVLVIVRGPGGGGTEPLSGTAGGSPGQPVPDVPDGEGASR